MDDWDVRALPSVLYSFSTSDGAAQNTRLLLALFIHPLILGYF